MTVCNACRYCEQYCPVFPAMEERTTFARADLFYLSNLCHNCGECLYACQYAPPHEFGIDVPRTLAELRLASYEDFCWPRPLARAFRNQGALTALSLAAGLTTLLFLLTAWFNPAGMAARDDAEFYEVLPHGAMVGVFCAVGGFVVVAMGIALGRFQRQTSGAGSPRISAAALARALKDAATLRHL